MPELLYKDLSYCIRGIAFDIYKQFRNCHKERIYHNAFILALKYRDILFETEKRIPVIYEEKKVGTYTPDLVVDGKILVELKAKPVIMKHDLTQFWHYLKGTEYKVGFLINFGHPDGVQIARRVYDSAR